MVKYITGDLEISSNDSKDSEEENFFLKKCAKKFYEYKKITLCKLFRLF